MTDPQQNTTNHIRFTMTRNNYIMNIFNYKKIVLKVCTDRFQK